MTFNGEYLSRIHIQFQVAYQKILQLSYVDKFLNEIQMLFRDKYKDDLTAGNMSRNFDGFTEVFNEALFMCEEESRNAAKKPR